MTYVELHCHSAYSFLDGASQPEEIAARAAELGLGVGRPDEVELVTGDRSSAEAAKKVRSLLDQLPGAAG